MLQDIENENSVISKLSQLNYKKLKEAGKIFSGMIPKLDNAFKAIDSGVNKVIIGKGEELICLYPENPEQRLVMNKVPMETLQSEAIDLLKELIATPSFSKEETIQRT